MAAHSTNLDNDIVGYNEDLLEYLNCNEHYLIFGQNYIFVNVFLLKIFFVTKNEHKYTCHCLNKFGNESKRVTNKNIENCSNISIVY